MSAETFSKKETITPNHAVVLPATPEACLMDYVQAVSAIVGASHIHSIHRTGPHIKVYMKEKKYVSTVIGAGVVVKGRRTNVDFFVPPASKVYLSNVDPLIPDKYLENLLSPYGKFESAIIHQKVSDQEGYSHIESSSRVVYMTLRKEKKIPSKFPFVNGSAQHDIDIRVEGAKKTFRYSSCQTD